MAVEVKFSISGLDQLQSSTNKIIKDLTSQKTALLLTQAKLVQARIKEKAPVGPPTDKKPGLLKSATFATALPETTTSCAVAFAGIREGRAPHGHLVEYGHAGPQPAPPHPFVRPAWDELKDTVTNNIAKGLGEIIEGSVD